MKPLTPAQKKKTWKYVLLVIFYPIGIAYLLYKLWKTDKYSKRTKVLATIAALFVLGVLFNPSNQKNNPAKTAGSSQTNSQTAAAPTEKPKPTAAPKKDNKIKVSMEGMIEPRVAQVGDKVVITIIVTNNDKEKTVDGIRLLSTNGKFLEKGIIVVDAVTGQKSFGGSYMWQNNLMKIPPGEFRNLVIVGQANEVGNYETQFFIKPVDSKIEFELPEDGAELNAKLTVLH